MNSGELIMSLIPLAGGPLVIRAILAFVLVFFLPGFAWTLVLFNGINVMERVALSFGLSIAGVVLSIAALNLLLGVRINGTNSIIIIIVITVIALALYALRRFVIHKKRDADGD